MTLPSASSITLKYLNFIIHCVVRGSNNNRTNPVSRKGTLKVLGKIFCFLSNRNSSSNLSKMKNYMKESTFILSSTFTNYQRLNFNIHESEALKGQKKINTCRVSKLNKQNTNV